MELYMPMLNNINDSLSYTLSELDSHCDMALHENEHYYGALKHIIINLSTCSELIVKFRLEEEHWAFLFSDLNRATLSKLEQGDFTSVDFDTAIQRLKNICQLSYEFSHCKKLRKFRNKIEHYTLYDSVEHITEVIYHSLIEVRDFIEKELYEYMPEEAVDDFKSDIKQLNGLLTSLRSVLLSLNVTIQDEAQQ